MLSGGPKKLGRTPPVSIQWHIITITPVYVSRDTYWWLVSELQLPVRSSITKSCMSTIPMGTLVVFPYLDCVFPGVDGPICGNINNWVGNKGIPTYWSLTICTPTRWAWGNVIRRFRCLFVYLNREPNWAVVTPSIKSWCEHGIDNDGAFIGVEVEEVIFALHEGKCRVFGRRR